MQWALLAGEQKVRAIIDSYGEVSFETGVVRQRGLSTMLHKRLTRFEAALEPSNSDGPMPHVDIGEHQWRNARTVLTWNWWGTAGAFAYSETVIESQRQNAPGTWIRLSRQFEKFLDFIHF